MESLSLLSLPIQAFVLLLCTQFVTSFDFWNATNRSVELPSNFVIDSENRVIIVAAKNSICHLSFDLQNQFNVLLAEPDFMARDRCQDDFRKQDDCQNYHHVLALPYGSENIISSNGTEYAVNATVLSCGSNAFSPMCHYRHRETLGVLRTISGFGFCPYKYHTGVASIWTSMGRLVTATPRDPQVTAFGISVSDSPYNGDVSVTTKFSDRYWFYNSPRFVSMYEIGDYIYVFFQEEALETTQNVVYSRVARVCKNDTGSQLLVENNEGNIFTTFLKARISCTSSSGTSGDIPFHYDEIQDTFFVPSDSSDGAQEHLYAVFTSAENGPTGSAVCMFTFGTNANDISNVFNGEYLQSVEQKWQTVSNYQPFTCEPGSRDIEHARDIQLMKPTATSSNGPRPLLVSEDYLFDRIVVSQFTGLENRDHDVIFIAAHSTDELVLIKASLSNNQPNMYHVIQTNVLGPVSPVSQMKINGEGSDARVYLGTDNGIYGIPVSNCSAYTDCYSCVSARDPYCAYSTTSSRCEAVSASNRASSDLFQDINNGNTGMCPDVETTGPATTDSDTDATTVSDCTGRTAVAVDTTRDQPAETTSVSLIPPVIGGLNVDTVNSTKLEDHTWTIVGAVVSFVVGVLVGIIVTAFFFRKPNIFRHSKSERDRRRRRGRYLEEGGNERKNSLGNKTDRKNSGGASNSKQDDCPKNNRNVVHLNEYTTVHPVKKSSSGGATHFTTKCPPSPVPDYNDSCSRNTPIPVPPPTPPFKKTGDCSFSCESPPTEPPQYRRMSTPVRSDPNMKSNIRTEERITNQQRAAYGRNILARAPSIDASKHSKYTKTTLPVVSPNLRFGTHHEFVHVTDAETGSSQC